VESPTFVYEGNLASFNPCAKRGVSLLFHTGASIPGRHRRVVGGGDTRYRGRFAIKIPPLLEQLGLVELEHNPRNNRVRAV
jgi:hypothetical protein